MSFIVQLASGIGSAVAQYQSLYRQQQLLAAQEQAAQSEAEAAKQRVARQGRIVQAQVIARAGAAGSGGSGSELDILAENAKNIAYDMALVRHQGELETWGLRETEKSVKQAQRMTMILGPFGAGSAAVVSGAQNPTVQRLAGNAKTWFTNAFSSDRGGYENIGGYGGGVGYSDVGTGWGGGGPVASSADFSGGEGV